MVVALSLSCSGHAVQDTAGPFENILLRRFWKGDRDCFSPQGRLEFSRGTLHLDVALVDYGQAFTQRICFLHVLRGQEDGQAGFVEFTQVSPSVSYTHLRAHETDSYLVCRLLL